MVAFLERLIQRVVNDEFLDNSTFKNELDAHRKNTIIRFLLCFATPALVFLSVFSFYDKQFLVFQINIAVITIISIAIFAFRHVTFFYFIIRICLFMLVLLYFLNFYSGIEANSRFFLAFIFPLIVLFLLGKKEGLLWCIFIFCCSIAVLLNPFALPTIDKVDFSLSFKTRFLLSFSLVTIMGYFYESSKSQIFQSLLKANKTLKNEIDEKKTVEQELKEAHAQLELNVKDTAKRLVLTNQELENKIQEKIWTEKALQEHNVHYQAILDNMEDAYMETDTKGNLAYYNRAFSQLMDFDSSQNYRGENIQQLVNLGQVKEKIVQRHHEIFKAKDPKIVSGWIVLGSNSDKKFWEITMQPKMNEKQKPIGFNTVFRDLSIQKQIEDQLTNAKKEKRIFLDKLSHELQTPLQGISAEATLGVHHTDSQDLEKIRNRFQGIEEKSRYAIGLLNNSQIQDKIESGNTSYQFKRMYLSDQVNSVLSEVRVLARKKNIRIEFFRSSIDDLVELDQNKIKLVIHQLLSHAILYSEKDRKIEVGIKTKNRSTVFSLTESGIATPSGEMNSIYAKSRSDNQSQLLPTTQAGIDLTLCKKIIGDHQGTVYLKKNIDGESVFMFQLKTVE